MTARARRPRPPRRCGRPRRRARRRGARRGRHRRPARPRRAPRGAAARPARARRAARGRALALGAQLGELLLEPLDAAALEQLELLLELGDLRRGRRLGRVAGLRRSRARAARAGSARRSAPSAAARPCSRARSSRIAIRSPAPRAANSRACSASRSRLCSANACSARSRRWATSASSLLGLVAPGARGGRRGLGLGRAARRPRAGCRGPARSAPRRSGARAARAAPPPRPGASAAAAGQRASRSTSSARERFSSVRSSLSWARRRRWRCLPSPAASSISIRRSRGRDSTIDSTRPCETTECISLPRPVSDSTSAMSASRQRAPLRRYSPSPSRPSLRTIEISEKSDSERPPELSITTSTSAALDALDAVAAGEDHVLHRLAADRERALLAERPEDGVGDVRLAGAVRADDDRHAGPEVERRAVREGLEALHRDRAQVHQPLSPSSRSSALLRRPPARRSSSCGPRRDRSPRP